uniref:hypothetical protein n=1 Tax=Staphylococcus aureus TaxID=1280 RepID=UPI00155D9AFF|nr:hypothetical protein [Staphylococcus aureus]
MSCLIFSQKIYVISIPIVITKRKIVTTIPKTIPIYKHTFHGRMKIEINLRNIVHKATVIGTHIIKYRRNLKIGLI